MKNKQATCQDDRPRRTESGSWPQLLDAVTAAPEHHEIVFENEAVRVLDTCVRPGERVPVHTHRWPSVVYVLSTGDFIRYDAEGNIVLDSRDANIDLAHGNVVWLPPLSPHSVENVGESEIRSISIEIKSAPYAASGLAYKRKQGEDNAFKS